MSLLLITNAAVITLLLLAHFTPLHCVSDWVSALHWAIELCSLSSNTAAKVAQEKYVFKVLQKLWLSCSGGLERDVAEREITEVKEKLVERQRESTAALVNRERWLSRQNQIAPHLCSGTCRSIENRPEGHAEFVAPVCQPFLQQQEKPISAASKAAGNWEIPGPPLPGKQQYRVFSVSSHYRGSIDKMCAAFEGAQCDNERTWGRQNRERRERKKRGRVKWEWRSNWRQEDKNQKKNMLITAKEAIKINHPSHIWHLCTALSKSIVVIGRLKKKR